MIKVRNIDPELKQWIMAQTSLGPCIGTLYYVAPGDSTTSYYRQALEAMGVTDFYSNVTNAYADTTANRNDIILVAPGAYDEGSSINWTKDNTHLIGLGGPNTASDYSEKNVVIYTDTSAIDYTIDLTGDHCQFINVGINNAGNSATNYAALHVNGYGNYFENVTLIGNLGSSQLSAEACASLYVGANAHNCRWINCNIGEDCWGNRSAANSGQLRFSSASQPNGGIFKNCYFRSCGVTATVAMVAIPSNGAVGRGWMFDNCSFHHTNTTSGATNCNQVFYSNDVTGTSGYLLLKDCTARGYDCWQDDDNGKILINMPQWYSGGGLTSEGLLTYSGGA